MLAFNPAEGHAVAYDLQWIKSRLEFVEEVFRWHEKAGMCLALELSFLRKGNDGGVGDGRVL